MRFIQGPTQLPYPPRACAVTNRGDGDFIDFNVVIDRPEPTALYMKREIVEEAAQLLGMVPAKEVEALKERFDRQDREICAVKEDQALLKEHCELLEITIDSRRQAAERMPA